MNIGSAMAFAAVACSVIMLISFLLCYMSGLMLTAYLYFITAIISVNVLFVLVYLVNSFFMNRIGDSISAGRPERGNRQRMETVFSVLHFASFFGLIVILMFFGVYLLLFHFTGEWDTFGKEWSVLSVFWMTWVMYFSRQWRYETAHRQRSPGTLFVDRATDICPGTVAVSGCILYIASRVVS